ncbi:hypothetical protein [Planctomicrobium sp. SH664]|uniref:hypothetical protein n=1 Tax=Planctomicrobium sp. SH664 TaxID=3448125 RepID=UPI003F5CB211
MNIFKMLEMRAANAPTIFEEEIDGNFKLWMFTIARLVTKPYHGECLSKISRVPARIK